MFNGGNKFIFIGAVVLALGACTTAEGSATTAATPASAAEATSAAPAVVHFGPDGFGKLTLAMSETEALGTGELQTSPVSTVLDKNVYSYVDGPKPDPKRMAADKKIEDAVVAADKSTDTSAAGSAKAAKAYADSAQRIAARLTAYLEAGGATFKGGKLDSIAAPKDVTTPEGIKRGSTVDELKAAYEGKGLKTSGKSGFELPLTGQAGWSMLFELDGKTVKYMSLIPA